MDKNCWKLLLTTVFVFFVGYSCTSKPSSLGNPTQQYKKTTSPESTQINRAATITMIPDDRAKDTPYPDHPQNTETPIFGNDLLKKLEIILEVGANDSDICGFYNGNQLWVSDFPFTEFKLLSEIGKSYRFPVWSSTKNWLAFVTTEQNKDVSKDNSIQEIESIWIMKPDGSSKKKISIDIKNIVLQVQSGCFSTSYISLPPVWSPDDKYILFAQSKWNSLKNVNEYLYYLVDTQSISTKYLFTLKNEFIPNWTSDKSFLVNDLESIKSVKLIDSRLEIKSFAFPNEVLSKKFSSVELSQSSANNFILSFLTGSTLISPMPNKILIWRFNSANSNWQKISELNIETWQAPKFIGDQVFICTDNKLMFFDNVTFSNISSLNISGINCNTVSVLVSAENKKYSIIPKKWGGTNRAEQVNFSAW